LHREGGQLAGFVNIVRDITDKKAAHDAVLESERRFRVLVNGVTDYAIFMLSPEGVVTNWNSGARRIKGYAAEEIIGSHFSRFYTPEDAVDIVNYDVRLHDNYDGRSTGVIVAVNWL
jgi:PAS domain-containing protein